MPHDDKAPVPVQREGRFRGFLASACSLLAAYGGKEPLHVYLKSYFSQHRKFGAKDRKAITALCYAYFRAGAAIAGDLPEKTLGAYFLCADGPGELLETLQPGWNATAGLPFEEKARLIPGGVDAGALFPFLRELSPYISPDAFARSLLIQPRLFIRARPGHAAAVLARLQEAGQEPENISAHCLALASGAKIDKILSIDREAVIQDYSSQRTLDLLHRPGLPPGMSVWDCCAGGGGKSILAMDTLPGARLTATDSRRSMLPVLESRLRRAGIPGARLLRLDLEKGGALPGGEPFDLVIADVPCTGSGTWARTPEQLRFFDRRRLGEYALLQQSIVRNALPGLAPGGYLLYITCSVFTGENEENVRYFRERLGLEPVSMQYLDGTALRADSMFTALLRRGTAPTV